MFCKLTFQTTSKLLQNYFKTTSKLLRSFVETTSKLRHLCLVSLHITALQLQLEPQYNDAHTHTDVT